MRTIDLMIFDLDGTIVSSGVDLVNSVNYTLKVLGLPPKTEKEIISFVGDGVRRLIERALASQEESVVEKALAVFSDYYAQHLLDNTKLNPYALEVLENFADKIKVILTNKRYNFTLTIARGLKIERYFSEIIGADSLPYKKPDARLIDYLLGKYKVERDKAVMIGDGINDIYVAKKSGISSVVYLSGLGNRKDLLAGEADYYCESLREINSLFK
ncbi:MAG TPA: HAD-IA family hydrolase [Smithellaceae bacterium]|nr:HAD-IA family hydrolase [Smithellaceae bacterium]HQM42711.1 HAD-IA family hydrolase [Smithellaceae bacterium]